MRKISMNQSTKMRKRRTREMGRTILNMDGTENAYLLHKELGEWMTDNITVVRYNDRLEETDEKIIEIARALGKY